MSLREDLRQAINRNSAENGSNTPDFMLAEFLTDCLAAFDKTTIAREKWYGRDAVVASTSASGPLPPIGWEGDAVT